MWTLLNKLMKPCANKNGYGIESECGGVDGGVHSIYRPAFANSYWRAACYCCGGTIIAQNICTYTHTHSYSVILLDAVSGSADVIKLHEVFQFSITSSKNALCVAYCTLHVVCCISALTAVPHLYAQLTLLPVYPPLSIVTKRRAILGADGYSHGISFFLSTPRFLASDLPRCWTLGWLDQVRAVDDIGDGANEPKACRPD